MPQFYYIKVGSKGVFRTRTCFPDGNLRLYASVKILEILDIYIQYPLTHQFYKVILVRIGVYLINLVFARQGDSNL